MSVDDRAGYVTLPVDCALRLVAACARPLADDHRLSAIREASETLDGDRVATLAHRHRIEGFVEQGLAAAGVTLGPASAARLSAGAKAARLQTLRAAGEEVRIGQAMAAAGIDALFIKGATIAMRAHGTLSLKTSWDVDVLVARADLEAACGLLRALGYRLRMPGDADDPRQVRRYLAGNKESGWHHPIRGTVVELHTELTDNPAALPSVGMASPRQNVELLPGRTLPTLATAPLFAYLAYHGTAHLWARLKWLADIVALIRDEDLVALHAEATSLGAGRTSGVALTLGHELLGLDVPSPLLADIGDDRATRRLLAHSRAAIASPEDGDEALRPLGEMIAYARTQSWLAAGGRHRWHAIRRFLIRPHRPAHLRLPAWALPFAVLATLPIRLSLRPLQTWRARRQSEGKTASRP